MPSSTWEQAFDCLRAPERRAVLLTLHERTAQRLVARDGGRDGGHGVSVDDLETDVDDLAMHHVHLPKLEDAGFVEREGVGDDNELVPGGSFDEIEPLLAVLAENRDRLPGIDD